MALLTLAFAARSRAVDIELPYADPQAPLWVHADHGTKWTEGGYQVWHLSGNVQLRQGSVSASSRQAIVWLDAADRESGIQNKVLIYLEGGVAVDHARVGTVHRLTGESAESIRGNTWFGRFQTTSPVDVEVTTTGPPPVTKPAIYDRGARAGGLVNQFPVQPAQFATPVPAAPPPAGPIGQLTARDVIIQSRGGGRMQIRGFPSPNRDETVIVLTSGVNVVVDGIENAPGLETGRIDLETDRLVIWTTNLDALNLPGRTSQRQDAPLEFYLEGNIVFRDGDRVIYAERMYYNVNRSYGVVLNAEVLTPVPDYQGLLRLKADALQQLDRNNFLAHGAAMTSSRLGVPSYWFQAETVTFQDRQQPIVDPVSGQPVADPQTGDGAVGHELLATSQNNFVYAGGVPVLYWPTLATDLQKPTFYVDEIRLRNDRVFGSQVLIDWDLYQLLGWRNHPRGTNWQLSTDYLSERGPAVGTNFDYDRPSDVFGPGRYFGNFDAWGIYDQGIDNLGADRRAVTFDGPERGRVRGRHRHLFQNGFQLTAELGYISDFNFLEQYFEREWDLDKDLTTDIELKRYAANQSYSLSAAVRLNDFFTQTEWLPRVDHFWLGQSLLADRLTWYEHSHAGYAKMKAAQPPTDPVDLAKWIQLPWEANVEGVHAATRQELDLPLELGPAKVTPYVLGEAAYWGEDLTGQELVRGYGQLGVRTSLPFWRVDPLRQSTLFNLNGLAHKISLEADMFYADASQDLNELPLYEPIDDDSTEAFRRRLYFNTFGAPPGGNVPPQFDPRYYAFRSGMQNWVTAPSTEIADDLAAARLGVHQRWQTKRGAPGREHVIDWITFDVDGTVFPYADRDNFGSAAGMLQYDFRWHVGDRVTLLSDGYADTFSEGLRSISVGGMINLPERGGGMVTFRSIEGPISSSVVTGTVGYRMSDKWIVTGVSQYDFGPTGNIGQALSFTRIGESILFRLGFNWDVSRGNVGAALMIEPRFLPNSRLGYVGGVQIPPAGVYGLE